jgi:hypothetical protein
MKLIKKSYKNNTQNKQNCYKINKLDIINLEEIVKI